MKNGILFVLLAFSFLLYQCSPKVKDAVMEKAGPEPMAEDFRKTAPQAGPAPKIELGSYEDFTLDNGLRVFVVENHKVPRISWQLFVDVPPFMENESAGYAQMAGALLSTGTKNRTKAKIDEEVDFIGASFSTGASGITAGSLTKHKEKLLELVSDVLNNPVFPKEEFDKLKKQTLAGLATLKDDPDAIAGNVSQILRHGKDHPYGEIQTEATVENITLDQCKAFYEKYFKPNISYLIVVGDISPAEVKETAAKYFGDWKKGAVDKEEYPVSPKPDETKVAFVNKSGAVQSSIRVTYPVKLIPGSADDIPARLMNTILGLTMDSRLQQNIREDKGFTYDAKSSLSTDPLVGYFNAYSEVRNEVTDSAVHEFLYELKRLRDEPVEEKELQLMKNILTGSFSRGLESPQTIAGFALNIARYNLPKDYYRNYLEKLNAVTVEDIQAMAKKYLAPENAHILVVGSKDDVAESLLKFDADGEIDFYDNYGNKIDISGVALPEGTTAESIIEKYLTALGGKEKLTTVEDMVTQMQASIQGQNLNISLKQKSSGKFLMSMQMQGMTVQEQKYNGEKAKVSQMGQSQQIEDEDELASMKRQAMPFPELSYADWGYKMSLKGVDQVEGVNAAVVEIETPQGETFTDYFDLESFLKIRSVSTQESPMGTNTITTDLGNYKDVNGVMVPFKTTISGAMPMPLVMEVQSIEINTGVADSEFYIE